MGWLDTYQEGGNIKRIDSILNANKHLGWIDRLYEKNGESIQLPGEGGTSTHYMAQYRNWAVPMVTKGKSGKLEYFEKLDEDYVKKHGIEFPSDKEALDFTQNYKKGTGVLPKAQAGMTKAAYKTSLPPIKEKEGLGSDFLMRQAFVESSFNPRESSAGAQGLTQFRPITIKELHRLKLINKDFDINDPAQAVDAQKKYMGYLYNRPWVNKKNQSEEVRRIKTLSAYNWGPQATLDFLEKQKKKGVDIYNSTEWIEDLPGETRDYIDMVQYEKNTEGRPYVQKNYQDSIKNPKFKKYTDLYNFQDGGNIHKAQEGTIQLDEVEVKGKKGNVTPEYKAHLEREQKYKDSLTAFDTQNKLNAQYLSQYEEVPEIEGGSFNLMEALKAAYAAADTPEERKRLAQETKKAAIQWYNDHPPIPGRSTYTPYVQMPNNRKSEEHYEKSPYGKARSIDSRHRRNVLRTGEIKKNSDSNIYTPLDAIFNDDTYDAPQLEHVSQKGNIRTSIPYKETTSKGSIRQRMTGEKPGIEERQGYAINTYIDDEIQPTGYQQYNQSVAYRGMPETKPSDSYLYDANYLMDVQLPYYNKPKEVEEFKGKKYTDSPNREIKKVSKVEAIGKGISPIGTKTDNTLQSRKTPLKEFSHYDVTKQVHGGHRSEYRTSDESKIDYEIRRQKGDEDSYWGKNNTLDIKAVHKKQDGGWIDKYEDGGNIHKAQNGIDSQPSRESMTSIQGPGAGTMRETEDQSFGSKTWDVLTHPMTALQELSTQGHVPDNFVEGINSGHLEQNPLELATDVINPFADINYLVDVPNAIKQGRIWDAVLAPLAALPLMKQAQAAETVISKGLTKHIYPKLYKGKVKEFKKFLEEGKELLNSEEGLKRLKNLGVDKHPFKKILDEMETTFDYSRGSSYMPSSSFTSSSMNLNPVQLKRLKKLGIGPKGVVDHELGHAIQDNFGKMSTYYEAIDLAKASKSTEALKLAGSVPNRIDRMGGAITFKKRLRGKSKDAKKYFESTGWRNKITERSPMLREMRTSMIKKGYIKKEYDNITPEIITKFLKNNPKNRMSRIVDLKNPKNITTMRDMFKLLPATAVGVGVAANQKQDGGWIDKYQDGGSIPKAQFGYAQREQGMSAEESNRRAFQKSSEQARKETAKEDVFKSMQEVYQHPLGQPGMFSPLAAEDILIGKALPYLSKGYKALKGLKGSKARKAKQALEEEIMEGFDLEAAVHAREKAVQPMSKADTRANLRAKMKQWDMEMDPNLRGKVPEKPERYQVWDETNFDKEHHDLVGGKAFEEVLPEQVLKYDIMEALEEGSGDAWKYQDPEGMLKRLDKKIQLKQGAAKVEGYQTIAQDEINLSPIEYSADQIETNAVMLNNFPGYDKYSSPLDATSNVDFNPGSKQANRKFVMDWIERGDKDLNTLMEKGKSKYFKQRYNKYKGDIARETDRLAKGLLHNGRPLSDVPVMRRQQEENIKNSIDRMTKEFKEFKGDELERFYPEKAPIKYNREIDMNQDGGAIKDNRGQWAHPGEITEIGSNQITMKGVPYPVLGVSDTGEQQMMYPEQDYKFKGDKNTTVTEYPMAQNGDEAYTKYKDSLDLWTGYIKKLKTKRANTKQNVIDFNKNKTNRQNYWEYDERMWRYDDEEKKEFGRESMEDIKPIGEVLIGETEKKGSVTNWIRNNSGFVKKDREEGLVANAVVGQWDPVHMYKKPDHYVQNPQNGLDTLKVSSPDDPRYIAYKDSLASHRFGKGISEFSDEIYKKVHHPRNARFVEDNLVSPRGEAENEEFADTGIMSISNSAEFYMPKQRTFSQKLTGHEARNYLLDEDGGRWQDPKWIEWPQYKKPNQVVEVDMTESSSETNSNFTNSLTPYGKRVLEIPEGEKESDYHIKSYPNPVSGNNDWTYVKNRPRKNSVKGKATSLQEIGNNLDTKLQSKRKPKKEFSHYDVKKQVSGGHRSEYRTIDESQIDSEIRRQALDKESYWGKNNTLDIKAVHKQNGGWLDKY